MNDTPNTDYGLIDPSKNTVVPPGCLKGLSNDTQKMLMEPITHKHPLVNDAKIRRLYLQATSQQWFGPSKIDFEQDLGLTEDQRRVWSRFNMVFYTLEKMGLNVIENMTAKAVRRLKSDEAAFYLTAQAADEARHVFLVEAYLKKLGNAPVYEHKYHVLGQVASMGFYRVENWLFSTLFSEHFASVFLRLSKNAQIDPIGAEICKNLMVDESRHLNFLYIVLPDIMDRLSLFGKTYVKASQYFIMKFTEMVSKALAPEAGIVGLNRDVLLEEAFENMERAYQGLGVKRDWLWFPKITSTRYKGKIVPVASPTLH